MRTACIRHTDHLLPEDLRQQVAVVSVKPIEA